MENFPIGYFFEQKWECDQKMNKGLLLKVYFKKEFQTSLISLDFLLHIS